MPTNYNFVALRDNRPKMESILGTLEAYEVKYPGTTPTIRYTLAVNPALFTLPKDWHKAAFVLDTGSELKVYYVAGYSQDQTKLYIDPIPSGGGLRYRGPQKTFFLTLTESE